MDFFQSIRVMTDHCREQEAILADFESREEAGFTVEAENDLLQRQMLSQENEFMELSADLERLRQETADNQARSRQQRRVLRRINTLLQGVRKALREGQSVSLRTMRTDLGEGWRSFENSRVRY